MGKPQYPDPQSALTLDIVCVDLDGTLAEAVWPDSSVGKPLPRAKTMLKHYYTKGWAVIIFTARPWSHRQRVWDWLEANGLSQYVYDVQCGKPAAALYIDDRAWNPVEEGKWDTTHVNKMS